LVDILFGIGMFINALLFIPQAVKVIKNKNANELSLVTFLGFNLIMLSAICYGLIHKDLELVIGYTLSFITCGIVTVLIIYFNFLKNH